EQLSCVHGSPSSHCTTEVQVTSPLPPPEALLPPEAPAVPPEASGFLSPPCPPGASSPDESPPVENGEPQPPAQKIPVPKHKNTTENRFQTTTRDSLARTTTRAKSHPPVI